MSDDLREMYGYYLDEKDRADNAESIARELAEALREVGPEIQGCVKSAQRYRASSTGTHRCCRYETPSSPPSP